VNFKQKVIAKMATKWMWIFNAGSRPSGSDLGRI